jgi:hypothetical protein
LGHFGNLSLLFYVRIREDRSLRELSGRDNRGEHRTQQLSA